MSPRRDDASLFRAIADSTYDWESWIDPEGKVRWINPAVSRMTGYSVGECLRMDDYPLPLVHPDDRERVGRALAGALAGESRNDLELRVVEKGGATRYVAISYQPMRALDGAVVGYRSSVRDIQERKKIEASLLSAKEEAVAANRAKDVFLANVSHELRTPMQAIVGYTELLQREPLSASGRRYTEALADQSNALLRLIDDLLEVSAGDVAPRLAPGPTDVRRLVRSVVDAERPLARRKGLSLTCRIAHGVPPVALLDAERVRQILANLTANAVKFTDKGGVRIGVSAPRRGSARRLAFSVADTGPGIAARDRARIFEPFFQVDGSSARRHGGCGLGLAICARLASQMAGELRVDSRVGRGSTFSFSLPLVEAEARALASGASADRDRPLSVLVVDDSLASREILAEFLARLGHSARAVADGRKAVSAAARQRFDVILMDLQMPRMDGFEAARTILLAAARRAAPPPRIVAMTAHTRPEERERCRLAGMDGFVGKPASMAALQAALAAAAPPRPDAARPSSPAHEPLLDSTLVDELTSTRARDGRPLAERVVPRAQAAAHQALAAAADAIAQRAAADARRLLHEAKGHCLLLGARRAASYAEAASQAASCSDWTHAEQARKAAAASFDDALALWPAAGPPAPPFRGEDPAGDAREPTLRRAAGDNGASGKRPAPRAFLHPAGGDGGAPKKRTSARNL